MRMFWPWFFDKSYGTSGSYPSWDHLGCQWYYWTYYSFFQTSAIQHCHGPIELSPNYGVDRGLQPLASFLLH
jgi:hypothetical protein